MANDVVFGRIGCWEFFCRKRVNVFSDGIVGEMEWQRIELGKLLGVGYCLFGVGVGDDLLCVDQLARLFYAMGPNYVLMDFFRTEES